MSNDYSDINNYIMKKEIGEGNFGKVKLAVFKPTGEEFAVKILNKKKIKKQMKNVMLRENDIITKLNHINIVFVYKIIDTEEDYYIIMEYCKLGELFDYIVKKKRLSEEEGSVFFYQLINGVEYIHSKGIAHRDLKPENLLLTEDKVLKIIDFGLSHEFNEEQFLKTKCGSPSYAAPEIIARPSYNGFKIDIWCCGIILYAMLCGYLPFEGDSESETNNVELFKNILECEPELPDFLSDMSKDLIYEILNPDPEERISIKRIKKHPFYLKGKKLCKIDYNSLEKDVIKTRESFYKNNNKEKKNLVNKNLRNEKHCYLEEKFNKNYNNIEITDINNKSNAKNSIDVLTNNKYKLTINGDNNYCPTTIENNIDKVTKTKLKLLSLKSKNKQKNEVNSFKKKYNPINLHNYNLKKFENINNLRQILQTEANENKNSFGLPFIGLRDAETFLNNLLSKKIKPNLENSQNNSINIRKSEDENKILNISKCPKEYVQQQMPNKINKNSLEYKINSCPKNKKPNLIKHYFSPNQLIFENMIKNNININKNGNEIIFSNINIKKNEKINMDNLKNNNSKITKTINAFSPGNLAISLSNENKFNRKKKYNRYNYEYDYNFNSSPNRKVIVKDSYTEALNSTNNIGNKMSNINSNKERNTIIPINIKHSEENIKTIIKKYPNTGENKMNCKSPEIKSIFNNIKINININSNTVDKIRNKNQARLQTINSNKKYGYNLEIPKKEIEQKLYILTDANKEENKDIFKSIAISPNKNYINNSERSNKRKGISLPHNNKNSKYNLTKIIQKVKNRNIKDEQNDIIKKNKSYVDNHSSIENPGMEEIKKKVGGIKIISNKNSNSKAKKKEDLLRYILFNSKNSGQNNYKIDAISINNQFLPKLNDHIYSH